MTKKIVKQAVTLYGDSAVNFIANLQGLVKDNPDGQVAMIWSGYEDCELEFQYERLETDEEYSFRIESEKAAEEYARQMKARKQKEREAMVKELEDKIVKLKNKPL